MGGYLFKCKLHVQNNVNPDQANILQTKYFNILTRSQFNGDNFTKIKSLRRPQLIWCAQGPHESEQIKKSSQSSQTWEAPSN